MSERENREGNLTTSDLASVAKREERPAAAGLVSASPGASSPVTQAEIERTPLFKAEEAGEFRSRWDAIQSEFVDEPRGSVERADSLVAEVIKRLAETFAEERSNLEAQWGRGEDVSTEGLRLVLRRYRSFFERLLST